MLPVVPCTRQQQPITVSSLLQQASPRTPLITRYGLSQGLQLHGQLACCLLPAAVPERGSSRTDSRWEEASSPPGG